MRGLGPWRDASPWLRLAPLYARALRHRPKPPSAPWSAADAAAWRLETDVRLAPRHRAAYNAAFGLPADAEPPLPYVGALSFPAQLAVMTQAGFPVPAMGLVHVAQTFTRHAALPARGTLRLAVAVGAAEAHPRRLQFPLTVTARHEGDLVWEGTATYACRLRPERDENPTPRRKESLVVPPAPSAVVTWDLDAGVGRRYARLSGDLNPIHWHPWAARLLGQKTCLAHGMDLCARLAADLARVAARLPVVHAEARFLAPVFLPGRVRVFHAPEDHGQGVAHVVDATRDEARMVFRYRRQTPV